ncbi:DUF2156 domain-containing protein [Candidatus Woesearchaeota archaeon]|nr:DUF2156 domain-containing protein [Candidatus Woesearchaeota archaeon]
MLAFAENRNVSIRHKAVFQNFFRAVEEPLADTTFTMRHIWAGPMKHTWTVINGNLCVFGFLKDRHVLWGPPVGGGKLGETIAVCFDHVEMLNKRAGAVAKPAAIYIPDCLKSEYESVANELSCSLGYWTQDYVYRTQDLIGLKGGQFDSKRHKANFFMKNYDYAVEEFDFKKHASECLELIDLWREQKEETIPDSCRYEIDSETEVAKKLVGSSPELGVKGIVVKVDGKVAGISLGEPLTASMCSNIIEKTNPALNGASEFIFREFARHLSSYEFLNAQDDFNVDYLKRVKLSYHPVKLLTSYCLEKK